MIFVEGQYMVVYIPVDPSTKEFPIESKAWISPSWKRAIESVHEFIWSDDFIAEMDCRFEIFDHNLEPVGDQKVFDEMVTERIDAGDLELGFPEDVSTGFHNISMKDEDPAIVQEVIEPPRPLPPERTVKFEDIKIEDHRT